MSRLKTCLLAILAITVLVTFASSAQASTIKVCPSSFPAVGAISAAVGTAASGTTINLCPGVYLDNVVVNQAKVKIIGQGKSGAVEVVCIDHSDPNGKGFDLEAYDDYVQNMKIANCTWGVYINGPSGGKDGVIRDNIFVNNNFGVEAVQTTTATVQANTFTNNGVAIFDNGSTSSDIGSNTVDGGGRVTIVRAGQDVVNECNTLGIELEGASKASVNSNHLTEVFAGVFVVEGTTGSKITNNTVSKSFEAFIMDQAGNNTVTGNEADGNFVGFQTTFTAGQDSINGKPNVIEKNKALGNSLHDLWDQSVGTEADGVGNIWHKNTCAGIGSDPASLCTD